MPTWDETIPPGEACFPTPHAVMVGRGGKVEGKLSGALATSLPVPVLRCVYSYLPFPGDPA